MKGNRLSRRYARALADAVEPTGQLAKVREELLALGNALRGSRPFRDMVRAAGMSRRQKKEFFSSLCRRLGLSAITERMVLYLVEKKRLALLPPLAESFAEEADGRLGIRTALLTSAMELTGEQRELIVSKLEQLTRARVRLQEQIDRSLIAGFQVRLDGQLFDASLRGRLRRINERIAHGG